MTQNVKKQISKYINMFIRLTVLSSRYIVFDKKSIPIVACATKSSTACTILQYTREYNYSDNYH